MPLRLLGGLAGAIAIGVAVVVASSGESADEQAPPAAPAGPREPARLTQAQRAQTLALLEADPRLTAALRGEPIDVARIGPWSSAEHEFIGASVILHLSGPVPGG